MTQQAVIAPVPVAPATAATAATAAPVVVVDAGDGEPTLEQLAALVGEPNAEAAEEPAASTTETSEPADGEAEAKPVDKPVEEAKPDTDAALDRATKAAQRAREGSRRYAETQRQLSEQSARVQQAAREADQLRRENVAARQREATLKSDPYKALKDLGMTDADLAARAMRENTPEAATMRLEAMLADERAARVALENRLATERAEATTRQAESAFLDAAKDADTYPELAVRRPAVQLVAAREALAAIRANGHETRYLSNAQIAEAADLWLASEAPKAKAAAKSAPAVVPVAKPAATSRPSGKTLTNAAAQTRTVAPANWDDLDEDQQFAHIAASLVSSGG